MVSSLMLRWSHKLCYPPGPTNPSILRSHSPSRWSTSSRKTNWHTTQTGRPGPAMRVQSSRQLPRQLPRNPSYSPSQARARIHQARHPFVYASQPRRYTIRDGYPQFLLHSIFLRRSHARPATSWLALPSARPQLTAHPYPLPSPTHPPSSGLALIFSEVHCRVRNRSYRRGTRERGKRHLRLRRALKSKNILS